MSHQHHVGPSAEAWRGERERPPRQELRGECRGGLQAESDGKQLLLSGQQHQLWARYSSEQPFCPSKLKTAGQTNLISRQAFPREPPDADVVGKKSILKRQ